MAHQGARNTMINDRNWPYSVLKLALKIAMAASTMQITMSMSVACQRLREKPIVCKDRPEEYRFSTFEDKRVSDLMPKGRGLPLNYTETRHTFASVPLWLHRSRHQGEPTTAPCSSNLVG